MNASANNNEATNDSTDLRWDPESRVALVCYKPGASLIAADGVFLVEKLQDWIGASGRPFAVLADGAGLRGTSAEYRALAAGFFRQHRDAAHIALIHLGPVIHVVVEMFRIGTGVQLKSFADEVAARSWLRKKGIAA